MIDLKEIDTIIFDMDGVLINSEPMWKAAEIKVFDTIGIDFIAVGGEKTVGLRIDEVVDYWYALYPWKNKTKAEVVDEIMLEMVNGIKANGKPMKGVVEILEFFKSKGMKIGLASSSFQILIDTSLEKLGIAHYFDVTLSAQNCTYGKPHPEVYIEAAKLLKSEPQNCLVIEDSLNGVIAGKAAKMNVVAVPDGTHEVSEQLKVADLRVDNLKELLKVLSN
ncbi:2-deoxyglucose-6-phosphatase [Brumimicrobium salinarum]|uniref:2-deoxyglucose-6-phosphatase n=1 Tax=Brumimicrobium salinarum TaxID=2058658 RepID=A0A2I0R614_9FLAO|nr:hexitol phosphatase HxpB [Brumimicrobium salinarum]PKR82009.1 2-deoxyglucose-6-phosphatase [Brumimicrobium salinarum]